MLERKIEVCSLDILMGNLIEEFPEYVNIAVRETKLPWLKVYKSSVRVQEDDKHAIILATKEFLQRSYNSMLLKVAEPAEDMYTYDFYQKLPSLTIRRCMSCVFMRLSDSGECSCHRNQFNDFTLTPDNLDPVVMYRCCPEHAYSGEFATAMQEMREQDNRKWDIMKVMPKHLVEKYNEGDHD